MEVSQNKLIFSTGKEVYCYADIVGLTIDPNFNGTGKLTYGYDGHMRTVVDSIERFDYDSDNLIDDPETLTKEECVELAQHMIKAWEDFLVSLDMVSK